MASKGLQKRIEKAQAQYRRILTNSLLQKGLNARHAELGANLIVEASRQNDHMLTRSANTYRLLLGMEAR